MADDAKKAGSEMASLGGKARAAKMTKEERSKSAKKAAAARWAGKLPTATHGDAEHPLRIGDVEIQCYVLDDGRRVISQRGFQSGIDISSGGGALRLLRMMAFFESKGIDCRGLTSRINNPIKFVAQGAMAHGYEANDLADMCDVILDARKAGVLSPQRLHMADRCEMLVRSFARVGITALVDEATGYQYSRTREELQRLLERYLSKELARWQPTFDADFYKHMFRLKEWKYDPSTSRRPFHAARLTVDLVYNRIHPDLLKELKQSRAEWEQSGKKKGGKLHQFLTTGEGHPRLRQHLEGVIVAMKLSKTWGEFYERLDMLYPPLNYTLRIPFPDDPDEEQLPALPAPE